MMQLLQTSKLFCSRFVSSQLIWKSVSALRSIVISVAISFVLVSCGQVGAASKVNSSNQLKSSRSVPFVAACLDQNTNAEARKTFVALLKVAEKSQCAEAWRVLAKMRQLYLDGKDIADLSPVSHLVDLQKLQISSNRISDLSPIASLKDLRMIEFTNNQITSLEPLKELVRLDIIIGGKNLISDLSPLKRLRDLEALALWSNKITQVDVLAELENLVAVNLFDNNVRSLKPLKNLSKILDLNFKKNPLDASLCPLNSVSKSLTELCVSLSR